MEDMTMPPIAIVIDACKVVIRIDRFTRFLVL
jgi:hypothetical protein